ncbi:Flagellar L-ring protein precursor [Rubripirellula lacrimiformis]|uniref:Flagellar L-ring protein n=1 Tax=Rubripirellula lacrimiformis TaxID=1930273 RepID=A0A517NGF0_9BACT|nr:flagellar basal body L-ring protein FlgH [Rubripirellula lacrimiformis]QDT06201.1 Flagellar L-ring protein precursor [Rubripirellula lacrimiformis]
MKSKLWLVATLALAMQWMPGSHLWAQNSSLMHAPMPTSPMGPRILGGQSLAAAAINPPLLKPVSRSNEANPGDVAADSEDGRLPMASPAAGYGPDRPPVMIDRASWTYQPAPPVRTFQKNDLVTIRVDEITSMMADGAANQRKQTLYETILTDWVKLTDFRLRPDPQDNGDPSIAAESNRNYRAQSSLQSREALTFNIAATVVDIRPNGSLVLEARKTLRVNDNLWETSLTGICRAQDIAPDNVVLSKDLIDLEIKKEDRGHLRDGYKRGWLSRFLDRVRPF